MQLTHWTSGSGKTKYWGILFDDATRFQCSSKKQALLQIDYLTNLINSNNGQQQSNFNTNTIQPVGSTNASEQFEPTSNSTSLSVQHTNSITKTSGIPSEGSEHTTNSLLQLQSVNQEVSLKCNTLRESTKESNISIERYDQSIERYDQSIEQSQRRIDSLSRIQKSLDEPNCSVSEAFRRESQIQQQLALESSSPGTSRRDLSSDSTTYSGFTTIEAKVEPDVVALPPTKKTTIPSIPGFQNCPQDYEDDW